MSDGDLSMPPDLPDDVAAVLRDARAVPLPEAPARVRVAARLAASTGEVIPGATMTTTASVWVVRVGLACVALAAIGVGSRWLRSEPPTPREVAVQAPVLARESVPSVAAPVMAVAARESVAADVNVVPASPVREVVAARPTASPRAQEENTLAAELALLGRAHAALSRGDFAGAESALGSHARRYPRGSLVHEREALRVQCLAAGGDRAAAEAARQRFHRRFPESVLGATVDRAVAEMR